MSASYVQATACQLRQHELQEVLLLSAQLSVVYKDSATPVHEAGATSSHSSTTPHHSNHSSAVHEWAGLKAEQRAFIVGLLGGAQARSLVTNALLRVHIPRSKQAALLQGNPFVQDYLQHTSASSSREKTSESAKKEEMTHRVGRLVALLPKPEPVSTETSHSAPPLRTSAQLELQRWLIAIDFGESVELMPLRAIADDAFSEAEHRIYVQSTLSSLTCIPGSTKGNSGTQATSEVRNGLLSSEQAASLRQTLDDVRAALRVAFHGETTGLTPNAANSSNNDSSEAGGHVKRPRDMVHVKREMDDDGEDGERAQVTTSVTLPTQSFNHDNEEGVQARLNRTTEQYNQLSAQLATLRRLLGSRDADLVQQLQQQRQAEARHAAELERWQSKVREESAARERLQREMTRTTQEQQGLLEQANVKLRRLAEMTMKYKQVVDEVKRQLGGETVTQLRTPEGILAELKKRPIRNDNE